MRLSGNRQPVQGGAGLALTLQTLTQEWQETDGNPANLQQMRENLVGREAAERLAKLDQERAEWQRRIDSWLLEREAITSNTGVSEADKQRQIDAVRRMRFNEHEELRVLLLEKTAASITEGHYE